MANPLMYENVWLQQQHFEQAEANYYRQLAGTSAAPLKPAAASPQTTEAQNPSSGISPQILKRLEELEQENKDLRKATADIICRIKKLEERVGDPVKTGAGDSSGAAEEKVDDKKDDDEEDDDVDMFGDDDDEEVEALRKKRLEEYAAKKAKKPAVIAKSSVILDVKPWDDETDMQEMEKLVRTIKKDGLVWGASKLVDLAYGIKKLQIMCVVEDEKVSVEDLREDIEKFEDLVQSVDVAAFNKI
ncbi:elongation factor 1-beta-like isoform X2 [Pomacea canaliculata]|uniref:elongation factor 1-beta-like isoform X2 n=1 Tax=Pomacea canaliculata TaxID=400727 RepID=UPI000D72B14A|nr:elongation factor 1-beta-like isoform X2 [Pomacea canaliculata]